MKKIYLIYAKIPSLLFDAKMHDFVSDSTKYKFTNKYYIGLYAWTTNKIVFDAFINFREGARDLYKIVIKNKNEFTKEEFKMFRKENLHEELLYYRIPTRSNWNDDFNIGYEPNKRDTINEKQEFFSKKDKVHQIACTRYEYEELFEYGHQFLFEYMAQLVNADYVAFKYKYQLALDYIGYCDIFNSIHDDRDDNDCDDTFYSERNESTQYNNSYGISYYGNPFIDIYENKLSLFINIFYEMIVGYKNGSEIKLLVYK